MSQAESASSSASFDQFLSDFDRFENFCFSKVNHAFWEILARLVDEFGWPVPAERYADADVIAGRRDFFVGGFVSEFLELLDKSSQSDEAGLNLSFSLSAWPGDGGIAGTPIESNASATMARFTSRFKPTYSGVLLKQAIHDGSFAGLLSRLPHYFVIVVGPHFLQSFADFARLVDWKHIVIHETEARTHRLLIESEIEDALVAADRSGRRTVVLLQAGTLATYWILRLRRKYPKTRWIDAGLALSISHPPDILGRNWGIVYRRDIVQFYNNWVGRPCLSERVFDQTIAKAVDSRRTRQIPDFVAFVENKRPNPARIADLLELCAEQNAWANNGPLWGALSESYSRYMSLPDTVVATPCANAGLGLEALARHHERRAEGRLRWIVSAFSFVNLARGYFANATVVDCDERGMLDLASLGSIDPQSYDGIVVTNIFGLWRDFSSYIDFAREQQKHLLIDNAAGIARQVAPWPYQVFSLHQTKPFGSGEGGLFIAPKDEQDDVSALLDYRPRSSFDRASWVNNGKISDIACAYHLDRLERHPEWGPLYAMQGQRIHRIAIRCGLRPLFNFDPASIATSQPYLAPRPVAAQKLQEIDFITLGKYYKPLALLPGCQKVFDHIVNLPCHPDVAAVDGARLADSLMRLTT